MKIKIIKDGPYIVTGGIPLKESIITPKGLGYEYREGKTYPVMEQYSLCRCGKSKNHPFCDGSHVEDGFNGKERAGKETYFERAVVYKGPDLDLIDDNRCGFARFCHTEMGTVWQLIEKSDDEYCRALAIKGASECPTGRLLAVAKEGYFYEEDHEPGIEVLQDPEKEVAAGLYVKGGIQIEGEDGFLYEVRNRALLCRCGRSRNKPFCDGMHVVVKFKED